MRSAKVGLGNTGSTVADEATPPNPLPIVAWRPKHERVVLDAAREGFATAVLRPGCVYGHRQSMMYDWFDAAAHARPISLVGDGTNRWAMVHIDDLAECYRVAIESRATGVLHATDDTRATLNDVARAIMTTKGSAVEIVHIPMEAARDSMGAFADALAIDQQVASNDTRQRIGWAPKRDILGSIPDLLAEAG